MTRRQQGFTLVEIAIVLVIIGLLLGGILKGQELINSARVRNIADTNSGIQAAYFGFIDRYRAVPGDMNKDKAAAAIGQSMSSGGNANGKLDGTDPFVEAAALWEHLWKAGFIQGSYDGVVDGAAPDVTNYSQVAPSNPFNGAIVLFRTNDYSDPSQGTTPTASVPSTRLNLILGENIPVNIARELDVKVDDARPLSGVLRLAPTAAVSAFATLAQADADCVVSTTGDGGVVTPNNDYKIAADAQNCNVVFLY